MGRWLASLGLPTLKTADSDELLGIALRGRPRIVAFDARSDGERVLSALRRLKSDSYSAVVPTLAVVTDEPEAFAAAFQAGADEVIRAGLDQTEE